MTKMYYLLVRIVYWLTWPLSGLYLHNSSRVRVLVVRGNEVLLVKSSYGSRRWSLPGGGVDRGESCMSAAVRELAEETGLDIDRSDLTMLGAARVGSSIKFPVVNNTFFSLDYSGTKEPVNVRPYEIQQLEWFPINRLPDQCSKSVQIALSLYKSHR